MWQARFNRQQCWRIDPLERRVLLAAQLVADLIPGPAGGMQQSQLYDVGGTLFFTATRQGKSSLWRTDGTAAGTRVLAPINSPEGWYRAAVGNTLYFLNGDAAHGDELWKSDGTPAGTVLVKDIAPGSTASHPRDLTSYRGRVYFTAGDQFGRGLWVSDGTAAGTRPVMYDGGIAALCVAGDKLYLLRSKGFSPAGWELWCGDGTSAGTSLVKDMPLPLVGNAVPNAPEQLTAVGDDLFFVAPDPTHGRELWRSDGTPAGTHMVADLLPGPGDSFPSYLTDLNGRLLFAAGHGRTEGVEPWISDGTAAGTRLIKDIAPEYAWSYPASFTVLADRAYFRATDFSRGYELWRTDGTAAGTTLVRDLNPGAADSMPADLTVLGDSVYFSIYDPLRGGTLWKTNGRGTDFVLDLSPATVDFRRPMLLTTSGDAIYFTADDGVHGVELWRYDEDLPVATLAGGQLTVRGTTAADRIALDYAAGTLRATMNGRVQSWPAAQVSRVRVDALDGADVVDCDALAVPATVNAGIGNDTITGGDSADFLRGEGGNDLIRGGRGNDRIEGNSGHDYLIGGGSRDVLAGGSGNDRIEGNSGDDYLYGDAGDDALWGGSGDDFLHGGTERDTLTGEAGSDVLFGAAGDDRLLAWDGISDILDGGDGFDSARVDPLLDVWASVERLLA